MKSALILHGKPPRERYENPEFPKPHKANWLPWISNELGKRGVVTAIPVFPEPYAPDYEKWSELFERYPIDADTSVIGHSAGAEFALRWLSEHKLARLRQLVLVAPWADVQGKYGDFSKYQLDKTLIKRMGNITIVNSLDDQPVQPNVQHLRTELPDADYVELNGYGHFMLGNAMHTTEFPELLKRII